jgi:hypothetical protein
MGIRTNDIKEFQQAHGCSLMEAQRELQRRRDHKQLRAANKMLLAMNGDMKLVQIAMMHNRMLSRMIRATDPGYPEALEARLRDAMPSVKSVDVDLQCEQTQADSTAWGGVDNTHFKDGVRSDDAEVFLDTLGDVSPREKMLDNLSDKDWVEPN